MKAKKIVTQTPAAPQAAIDAAKSKGERLLEIAQTLRAARPTARIVHQTSNRIASDLDILQNSDASKTQLREATAALLNVIEGAKYALLRLTGAPGIISQSEIAAACAMREDWGKRPFSERMAVRQSPDYCAILKLHEHLNAGWFVQPGPFYFGYDRTGVIVMGERNPREPRPLRHDPGAAIIRRAPRQADPETPSPETLQAWYDLPGEPRQAEGSPSES